MGVALEDTCSKNAEKKTGEGLGFLFENGCFVH